MKVNLWDVIKVNPGFEIKSDTKNREYLSLKDKYKTSDSDCSTIYQLYNLGFEDDDKYIVPEYQRELVWTLEQKENLIKSILAGNPIGDFLFKKDYERHPNGRINECAVLWSVIDGQQRVNAIREFIDNKFTIDDKYFKSLKYWDARSFIEGYQIKVISIENITLEEEINIYLQRNCGGTMHTKEELEKAKSFLDNTLSFDR